MTIRKGLYIMLFVAMASSLLTACSQSETVTTYEQEAAKKQEAKANQPSSTYSASDVPITFDVYTGERATTRSSTASISNLADLATEGFSVFAYLTGAYDYDPSTRSIQPNFMYNQKVMGTVVDVENDEVSWNYTPLKYWPNDYNGDGGAVDNQTPNPSTGTKVEKLSFFAYAPHVDLKKVNGSFVEYGYDADEDGINDAFQTDLSTGIVAISKNTYGGEPFLIYDLGSTTSSGDMRDLLYATNNSNEDDDVTNDTTNKTKASAPISFNFKHALAAFGFGVCGIFNAKERNNSESIDANSFIRIEKIELTTSLSQRAILNLNSGVFTPEDASSTTITLNADQIAENLRYTSFDFDNGTEEERNSYINNLLSYGVGRYYAAIDNTGGANYTNGAFIPSTGDGAIYQQVAVSKDNNNSYRNNFVYFIPTTGNKDVTIRITYHTLTRDARMKYGYSDVKNVVENTLNNVNLGVATGKYLTFNMQLGMNKVSIIGVTIVDTYQANEESTTWSGGYYYFIAQ